MCFSLFLVFVLMCVKVFFMLGFVVTYWVKLYGVLYSLDAVLPSIGLVP